LTRDSHWRSHSCSLRSRHFARKIFAVFTSLSVAPILVNTEALRLASFMVFYTYRSCLKKCSFTDDLEVSRLLGMWAQCQSWRRPCAPCPSSRSRRCERAPSLTSSLRQPLRRCPPALPTPRQTRRPLAKPKNPSVLAQVGRTTKSTDPQNTIQEISTQRKRLLSSLVEAARQSCPIPIPQLAKLLRSACWSG
jgi:hypothetical protein